MGQVVLNARSRAETGSVAARRIRREGRIPGVLYGRTGKALSLDLNEREFTNGIRGISESTIVKVEMDGKSHDVFVKNTQRNIIDGKILHVDFYEIESGRILRARVSIILQGNPIGVREGGVLEFPLHEIEVECLPKDLPERIELDISSLGANQTLHVRDIPLAQGIRLITGADQVVALVKFARDYAPAAAAEGAAAPAAGDAAAPAAADAKEKDAKQKS